MPCDITQLQMADDYAFSSPFLDDVDDHEVQGGGLWSTASTFGSTALTASALISASLIVFVVLLVWSIFAEWSSDAQMALAVFTFLSFVGVTVMDLPPIKSMLGIVA